MSTVTEDSPSIKTTDLGKHPRAVQKIIMEAVNKHGVQYRIQDGTHIRLFNGDREVNPIKISAVRPAEHTVRYLIPWLEKNVPTWLEQPVSKESLEALAAVVNSEPKAKKPVVAASEPDTPDTPDTWVPWKYGLETNGTDYRCMTPGCDFRRSSARGVHLHQGKHTGKNVERAKRGGTARGIIAAQRVQMRREAARVIAEQNHLVVYDKEDAPDAKTIKRLEAQVAELTKERDDLKARLDLLREAMRA